MTTHAQPKRIVVAGAGLAGLRVIEQLRAGGHHGQVVLLGAESHPPYDRPPLSKQVLRGEHEITALRPENDFSALDVDFRPGHVAEGIDTAAHIVHTSHGDVSYDVAIIATGARPKRLPGINGLVLRTREDAQCLKAALTPGGRIGIIGAGLIGCEVAASARSLGVEVVLLDVLNGPLIRVVGPVVSQLVADLHNAYGVDLRFGHSVRRVGQNRLLFGTDAELTVDAVLEAVGASPDTDWLRGSAIGLADGVICDAEGRAAPDVFAVGDVARWNGKRNEHWTNAVTQAGSVSATVLGLAPPPAEPAYWWSDQYDIKLQGVGSPAPDDDVTLVKWGRKARNVALYSRDGRLTGAVGFSAVPAIMNIRRDLLQRPEVDAVLARLSS